MNVNLTILDMQKIILALDLVEVKDMIASKASYEELIGYLTRVYLRNIEDVLIPDKDKGSKL